MVDVTRISKILKEEYGINNREELKAAMSNMAGIDIGIFVSPMIERRKKDYVFSL